MDCDFLPALVTELFDRVNFVQWSQCPLWGMNHGMMGGAWGWIGGIFMMFFWVLVLIALALFIRWLVTAGGRGRISYGPQEGTVESALDVLKKRYARGEITKEQFETMRRDIE